MTTSYTIKVDANNEVPDYEKIINDFSVNPGNYSEEILEVYIADMVDIYCDARDEGVDIAVIIDKLIAYAKTMHELDYN